MSAYTRVSKDIGWDQKKVALPTEAYARQIVEQAKSGHEHAFRELFRIYRFAGTPQTEAGLAIITIIANGFRDVQQIFRDRE